MRPRDAVAVGATREHLIRLTARGLLVKQGRGIYALPSRSPTEYHSLLAVQQRIPHGVVCLLSALQFHGITTQLPSEVWIALERGAWRPRVTDIRLRVIFLATLLMTAGAQDYEIEGGTLTVFTPARTVVDCFKFRNKIGLDVALEALREVRHRRLTTADELWHFAKLCRVANVMRPYLEAIV